MAATELPLWQTAGGDQPELIAKLEQFGELRLTPLTKEKLLRISAASIDRLIRCLISGGGVNHSFNPTVEILRLGAFGLTNIY